MWLIWILSKIALLGKTYTIGKRWFLREDGQLEASEGETEFSHIPDWFQWEREQVRAQKQKATRK